MKAPLPPDNPMPPPLPPTPDQVIIRKDYDPKGNMLAQMRKYQVYSTKLLLCEVCVKLALSFPHSFQASAINCNSR